MPLTLTLKLDLDMVKMYYHTKNGVSVSTASKVIVWTNRQTDTHTHATKRFPLPHTREVNVQNLDVDSPLGLLHVVGFYFLAQIIFLFTHIYLYLYSFRSPKTIQSPANRPTCYGRHRYVSTGGLGSAGRELTVILRMVLMKWGACRSLLCVLSTWEGNASIRPIR